MSDVTKMLKNFPRENIEEKNGNMKAVIKGDSSLDLNQSSPELGPKLNLALNSTAHVQQNPPRSSRLHQLQGKHMKLLREQEYGCNYCSKKYSSKQALGGHQNAHRSEKAIGRPTWRGHDADFGYSGSHTCVDMAAFPSTSSFNQAPQKTTIQPVMSSLHHCQSQMSAGDYPGCAFPISMPHKSHLVQQSLQGLNFFCTSSSSPQFMSFHTRMGQGTDIWKAIRGSGIKKNQAECKNAINNSESQHLEDEGLDLSLKL